MKRAEQLQNDFELQDLPIDAFGTPTDFTTHRGIGKIAQADVEWEYRLPDELSRDSSVIITPGYFAKQEVYDGLADSLASQGVATATYKAIRRQGNLAGWHSKHLTHPERLVYQAPWAAIKDIRLRHGDEAPSSKFTFVGHSMGGRTAVMNALTHPDSVDGVVMLDAAGLENHSLGQMLGRLPDFFTREVIPTLASNELGLERSAKLAINSLLYLWHNPMRTLAEGVSIATADIKPAVERLQHHGIPSAIIVSNADTLVHATKAVAHAGHVADVLHVMHDPNLGHLGPLRHPEKYGSALLQIIQGFDSQKLAPVPARDEAPGLKLAA